MRFTIACPHCGARGIARAMEKKSEIDWEIDFQCDDVTCGHTYRTKLEMLPPVVPIPKRPQRSNAELKFDL